MHAATVGAGPLVRIVGMSAVVVALMVLVLLLVGLGGVLLVSKTVRREADRVRASRGAAAGRQG